MAFHMTRPDTKDIKDIKEKSRSISAQANTAYSQVKVYFSNYVSITYYIVLGLNIKANNFVNLIVEIVNSRNFWSVLRFIIEYYSTLYYPRSNSHHKMELALYRT